MIQDTIQRVVDLRYPRELVQVLVVIEAGDAGTIAEVEEKLAELRRQGIDPRPPAHLRRPADQQAPRAERGPARGDRGRGHHLRRRGRAPPGHPQRGQHGDDRARGRPVVQCGVQLMNYADRWFSALNVLEYFFWFKSRMHYHARGGDGAPGGQHRLRPTRTCWSDLGGWDQNCLTEDADLGIRLSARGRAHPRDLRRRVRHPGGDAAHGGAVRQAAHALEPGLPAGPAQGRLAAACPPGRSACWPSTPWPFRWLQAVMMLYVPLSLWMMLFAKMPVLVAMLSSLPLYMLLVQFRISVVGLYEFTPCTACARPCSVRSGWRWPTCPTSGCWPSPPCARCGARRGARTAGRRRPTSAPTAQAGAAAAGLPDAPGAAGRG